jgi:hypothetical protein
MVKIRCHLDGEFDRLLAFKMQWLRMHPNAYKGSLVSSTSSRTQGSLKPNKPNKKRQSSDDRPSANLSKYEPAPGPKRNRPMTSRVYSNLCKTAGKPEDVWSSHHIRDCPNNTNSSGKDLKRRLRDDFKGRARGNTANDSYYTIAVVTALWEEISMMTIEWAKASPEIDAIPHRSMMTTASEANTIATALLPRL